MMIERWWLGVLVGLIVVLPVKGGKPAPEAQQALPDLADYFPGE